jgi:predicted site-specific integrase-resolvase
MKASEVRKILNITQPTLSKYANNGLIKFIKINKYHYEYNDEDVYKIIGIKKDKRSRKIVSYSRVSTGIQKSQLDDQSNRIYEYSISKGLNLDEQYKDIKSGMNFERKSFQELIENVIKGNIELVIVENKDRLVRFGFELIELIFRYFGAKILVINDTISNKNYQQELTEDLVSIIHYFSMKMYSHRRKLNKLKKELLNQ